MEATTINGRYRVAWIINGRPGNSQWSDDYTHLSAWEDEMCLQYGAGTHWIEERPEAARAELLAPRK